jgi:hypothetical protein
MAKDLNGIEIPSFEEAGTLNAKNRLEAEKAIQSINRPIAISSETGENIISSDNSEIGMAAMSDTHHFDPNETFNVVKYDGTITAFKGSDIKEALQSGQYQLESKEAALNRKDQELYGSRTGEAAALGAARALSFGTSDPLLVSSGKYTGDELRGLESASPIASIGGEVGVAVGQALLSGGTSLLAKGATKVGAGLAASEALGAAAGKAVEKNIAKKILANSAEKLSMAEAKTVASLADEAAAAINSGAAAVSDVAAEKSVGLMAKSLEKAGYASKTAKSIADKMLYGGLEHMAPDAANLAIQGAMQGAGRLVTEDAFGTADFNAENLLAYAGVGSLIGGTFGSAIGLGKAIAPKAADLLSPLTTKAKGMMDNLIGEEKIAMNLVDLSPSALAKARAKSPDFDKNVTAEIKSIIDTVNPKTYKEFDEAIISSHSKKGQEIESIYRQADELNKKAFSEAATTVGANTLKTADTISANLIKAADDHLNSLGIAVTKTERDGLFKIADELASAVQKDLADDGVSALKLQEYAKSLQSKIYTKGAVMATEAEASQKLMRKKLLDVVRAEQRELVRDASNFAGAEIGKGSLLDQLISTNKSYSTLNEVVYNSQKSLAKDSLGSGKGLNLDMKDILVGSYDLGAGIGYKATKAALNSFKFQKALVMGSLDGSAKTVANATLKGLKALKTGVVETVKATEPSIVRSLTSSQLAIKDSDGKKIKPKNEQEAYNNIVDNAMVAVTDPERVLQQSNKQTAAMFEHAPNTAAAVDAKYLQMMQFIASKSKKSNKNTGIFDVNKVPKVSGFETAKMARYLDAISNPQGMLDKVAKGNLSREHVEVMKNIFPEMHNKMKMATMDFISKNQSNLKYSQKLQLGLLLDMQSHESMQPQNIQALQSTFAPEQSSSDASYNQGAVGDMSKASSLESGLGQTDIGE